jgi:hypothetical protein
MLFCVVLLRMRSLIARVCNFGVVSECDGFIIYASTRCTAVDMVLMKAFVLHCNRDLCNQVISTKLLSFSP